MGIQKVWLACISLLTCMTYLFAEDAKPPLKAIIFDFGGVIATVERDLFLQYISADLNIGTSEAYKLLKNLYRHLEKGGADKDFWMEHLRILGYTETEMKDWLTRWDSFKPKTLKEIPGMLEIVSQLQAQGYCTPLFSNVTEDYARIIHRVGLYKLFKPLFLSYKMGTKKPDPQSYQYVVKALNLSPKACLLIDDCQENIEGALKEGLDGIHFQGPSQLIKELSKRGIMLEVSHASP